MMRGAVTVGRFPRAVQGGGGGSAPAWFTSLTPEKWTEVGQSLNSFDPEAADATAPHVGTDTGSTQQCFEVWTGPVMDTDLGEMLFVANQGHGDGGWNGVLGFSLLEATPQWRVHSQSSDQGDEGDGTSADGGVASSHSYGMQAYCPSDDRVYLTGLGATAFGGFYRPLIATWGRSGGVRGFDTTTFGPSTAWTAGTTSDRAQYGGADWDLASEKIVASLAWNNGITGLGVMTIDPVTEAVTFSGTVNQSNSGLSVLSCAGTHGVALMLYPNGQIKAWDTSDLGSGIQMTATPSGGPSLDSGPDIVWHEASNAFLVRAGTSKDLYKLAPASWASPFTGWAWTSVATDATGATPDAHYGNGSYGKFRIIPDMGNGEACLVLIPRETSVPLVMRLDGAL